MELIKQKLCFRITAKLGNSKKQHYSWQEKKQSWGHCLKKLAKKKKRRRKDREKKKSLFDAHFGKEA